MTQIKSKSMIKNNAFEIIFFTLMAIALMALITILTGCDQNTESKDYTKTGPVVIKANNSVNIAHFDDKVFWIRYEGINTSTGWAKMCWPGLDGFENTASWDPAVIHEHYLLFYGKYQFKISIMSADDHELIIQTIERAF